MNAIMEFTTLSIDAQIKSVERESGSGGGFGGAGAGGKMKQATADYEISAMRAVLETLRGLV